MLTDEEMDKFIKILMGRLDKVNEEFLISIGTKIKDIGKISQSDIYRLQQMKQFGADADKIVRKISEINLINLKDVQTIFEETAKRNYNFSEKFYKHMGLIQIPFKENDVIMRYVKAISDITGVNLYNLSNTTVISEVYKSVIDEAILNVSRGVRDYKSAMRQILKKVGGNGIQVRYESGYKRRLDSAVRQNVLDGVRDINQKIQNELGKEFGADGVEISVHFGSAPDHEPYQGKIYSMRDYELLQNTLKRRIGTYNCHHFAFNIILGVSEPTYTKRQLELIIEKNNKGVKIDGKDYTIYECTQLQRKLETEIRRQKDISLIAKAAEDYTARREAQTNINNLKYKYIQISKLAGLDTHFDRIAVKGFRAISVK